MVKHEPDDAQPNEEEWKIFYGLLCQLLTIEIQAGMMIGIYW
jgi:hypothetical protein